jgi:hypothetical protein
LLVRLLVMAHVLLMATPQVLLPLAFQALLLLLVNVLVWP